MKKYIIIAGVWIISSDVLAVIGVGDKSCYISNCLALATADSTCDSICDWCPGSVTTPTGYVNVALGIISTSISRSVTTVCNDSSSFSCVCSEKTQGVQLNTLACDTGYYGTPSYTYTQRYGDVFTGCIRCPSSGGVYGTTSGPGATSVTECYIPAGITFSDNSGSGTYSSDCYYSN